MVLVRDINITLDVVKMGGRVIICMAPVPHAYTCKNNRTCMIRNLTGLALIQTEFRQYVCNQFTNRQVITWLIKTPQHSTQLPPSR